jgi:hypothetical protein
MKGAKALVLVLGAYPNKEIFRAPKRKVSRLLTSVMDWNLGRPEERFMRVLPRT